MAKSSKQQLPSARKEGLLVETLPDEVLVYDLDRKKAHCLNQTAAMIWNECDGNKTATQIAARLSDESGKGVPEEVVWLGLARLEKTHLLKERITPPTATRLSRREVIRRIGVAAAVGLPLVTSILAPRASEAQSCVPQGGSCMSPNAQCCPPLICNLGSMTCQANAPNPGPTPVRPPAPPPVRR
jgi:hypothetical protein